MKEELKVLKKICKNMNAKLVKGKENEYILDTNKYMTKEEKEIFKTKIKIRGDKYVFIMFKNILC